jgi:hypothetical protein
MPSGSPSSYPSSSPSKFLDNSVQKDAVAAAVVDLNSAARSGSVSAVVMTFPLILFYGCLQLTSPIFLTSFFFHVIGICS